MLWFGFKYAIMLFKTTLICVKSVSICANSGVPTVIIIFSTFFNLKKSSVASKSEFFKLPGEMFQPCGVV